MAFVVLFEWRISRLPVMPLKLFTKPAAEILFTHFPLTRFVYYLTVYKRPSAYF